MNNANNVTTQKKTGVNDIPFANYMTIPKFQEQIINIVGKEKKNQFVTSIISSVQTNPTLKECTNTSIFNAALIGAALNLSPSPQLGQFYMVPFNNKKKQEDGSYITKREAQFQLGYKGYMQLAIRSGQLRKINVVELKEGELIHYDFLQEEIEYKLIEDEFERENTPTAGYYAYFKLVDGYEKSMYWSKNKMLIHADKYSQAFSLKSYNDFLEGKIAAKDMWKFSSFWYKDFDEMAKKTMLRQLISKGGCPMSIEMQTAFENDMAVFEDGGNKNYVENPNVIGEIEEDSNDNVEQESSVVNTKKASTAKTTKKDVQKINLDQLED